MKTIAVLTDFSKRAENAAQYALHLAEHLHANIKLYNFFFVPSENPLAAQIAWPMENYKELKMYSVHQLELFSARLKKEYSGTVPDAFRPAIECECHDGELKDYLADLEAESDVLLLVVGEHDKNVSAWLTSNHLNDILDNVTLPVLVIATHQKFSKIHKIAFATDLSTGDIEQIHSLTGLASALNAEILIVHVANDKSDELELQHKADLFLSETTRRVLFPKVYYRRVKSDDIQHGLDLFAENDQIDLLVMVHRHKSFLQELFETSISKNIAKKIQLPLLIYPSPAYAVPVF